MIRNSGSGRQRAVAAPCPWRAAGPAASTPSRIIGTRYGRLQDVRHIRFPPKWRLVLVPETPRSATALGITLYTASKPAPLAAQRALWAAARLFGGRALPGAREQWQPPLPAATFAELRRQLAAAIGRDPEAFAIYERPQRERAAGLTLLACAGRDSLLVRVRADEAELALERRVSAAHAARPAGSFRVP